MKAPSESLESIESIELLIEQLPVESNKLIIDYITNEFNLGKAAELSGLSVAKASAILNSTTCKEIVAWYLTQYAASPEEVLALMTLHARIDVSNYIKPDEGTINLEKLIQDGKGRFIREIKIDQKTGAMTVKLHDAQRAIDQLAKAHKMYAPEMKMDLTLDFSKLSDDQLHRLLNGEKVQNVVK